MLKGTCSTCGFLFLLEYGLSCPACNLADRTERVKRTFAPVDMLRTALAMGIETEVVDDKCFRIPRYEDEQVYQLKRMRKLIGRL